MDHRDHRVVGNMVFFTKQQLEDSPSRRDGMSAEEEAQYRRMAQQIIIDVCQSMSVHVQCAYVAVYLCLRYFAVKSWKRNDRFLIMPAALSLALKMRESPKPVSHIIAEFEKRRWREYERNRPAEPRRSHDKAYIDSLKEPFCLAERAILFVVGFEFGIGDPYPHVGKQLRALGVRDDGDRSAKIDIQQMAWNFLRDSLNTTLSLRYPPEKIAATAVFLALQVYRRPLVLSAEADQGAEEGEATETPKSFCEVCNIYPQELLDIGNEITANYVAAVRFPPVPQVSPQPAPKDRVPVSLSVAQSEVKGDRWTLVPGGNDAAGGGGHGGANGAAGAGSSLTPGRGGGSHVSSGGGAAMAGAAGTGAARTWAPCGGARASGSAAGAAGVARAGRQSDVGRFDGTAGDAGCGPSSLQQRAPRGGASYTALPPGGASAAGLDTEGAAAGVTSGGSRGVGGGAGGGRAGKRRLDAVLREGAAAGPGPKQPAHG